MQLVLLGAPGAGKGTHAVKLAEKYGIPHISTGDIFRMNIKNGTELGKLAKSIIDAGKLVPDEVTIDLVLDRLAQPDCEKGYILDGFPRNLFQAEALTKALAKKGTEIDYAIHLQVEDDVIVNRMANRRVCQGCGASYSITQYPPKKEGVCDHCGDKVVQRSDDKPETVKARLQVYHEQTEPIVQYYRNLGKELLINSDRPMHEVYESIVAHLGE